jgi:hypothetical protein
MSEGKFWETNGARYLVLDCRSSSSPLFSRVPGTKVFWHPSNYWKDYNDFVVYHVRRDQVMSTREFVNLVRMKNIALLVRRNNELQVLRRTYNELRKLTVSESFAAEHVGAYLLDGSYPEDQRRLRQNYFSRASVDAREQKAAQEQKEREEKEALRERLEKAKNAIPSPLLAELRENIQNHCKTLRSLPVKRLRELVKTVTEKSEIDEDIKDRILIAHQKWNKRELCNWLSHQGEVKMDKIPKKFLDPVYGTVMLDPVVLPFDGTTVDRATYLRIMGDNGDKKNPFTREPIPAGWRPIPNKFAREAIEKHLVKYGIDPVTATEDD